MTVTINTANYGDIFGLPTKPSQYWLEQGLVLATRPYHVDNLVDQQKGSSQVTSTVHKNLPCARYTTSSDIYVTPLTYRTKTRTYVIRFERSGSSFSTLARLFDKRQALAGESELLFFNNAEFVLFYNVLYTGANMQCKLGGDVFDVNNTIYTVALRHALDGGEPTFFVNGNRRVNASYIAPIGTPIDNTSPYCLGNRDTDRLRGFDGYIFDFLVFDSLLDDYQMAEITSNIDCVYQPKPFVFPLVTTSNPFVEGYFNRTAGSLYYGNKLTYLYEGRQYAGLPT